MSQVEGEPTQPVEPEPKPSKGKLRTLIIAVVVLLLVLGGAGAFAVWKYLLPHGREPEAVLPANTTIFLVTFDGDPSASQKLAALHFGDQFPGLKQALGLSDKSSDLRQVLIDAMFKSEGCPLTFDKDVKPWIGKRIGVAGVQGLDKAVDPVVAIQISDSDAAKRFESHAQAVKCSHDTDATRSPKGRVFTDDYVIIGPSKVRVQQLVDDAKKHALADDASFKKWQSALGDRGIINAYVSPKMTTAITDAMPAEVKKALGSCATSTSAASKFTGASATVRFTDHGLELAAVAGGLDSYAGGGTVATAMKRLPANSAIVLSAAFGPSVATDLTNGVKCGLAQGDPSANADQEMQDFEKSTGITLPGDLQTLLGKTFSIALGGTPPADLDKISGAADVPAAITVDGDGPKIQGVVAKVLSAIASGLGAPDGTSTADILSHFGLTEKADAATYTIGGTKSFVDAIGGGGLSTDPAFVSAVPYWNKAVGVFFIRFDSAWRDAVLAQAGHSTSADQAKANTAPLVALGAEAWRDGTVLHATIKLATK